MEDNKVIMVVVAHPDDPEFGAGGTVAKFVLDGWQAIYVICTNGDKGTSDLKMTSEKLAKIREHEQMNAAKVLGISEVVFLRYPDG
jgi:LmbE family N-acetylglucosaminyl deacetylase